jgi:ribosomal protein S18 acetylase RimI-like enzyme
LSNDLTIRAATPADIPAIRDITMQVWPPTYVPIIGEQQVSYMIGLFYAPEHLKKQMAEGHNFIVCYSGSEPVGFAGWSEIEPNIYKLHKLYVLTTQQGRGVGKLMMDHIIKEIKAAGATALRLNVNRYNFNAKAFYERTGFTLYKDEDIDIGNGFFMNDHVLELPV